MTQGRGGIRRSGVSISHAKEGGGGREFHLMPDGFFQRVDTVVDHCSCPASSANTTSKNTERQTRLKALKLKNRTQHTNNTPTPTNKDNNDTFDSGARPDQISVMRSLILSTSFPISSENAFSTASRTASLRDGTGTEPIQRMFKNPAEEGTLKQTNT